MDTNEYWPLHTIPTPFNFNPFPLHLNPPLLTQHQPSIFNANAHLYNIYDQVQQHDVLYETSNYHHNHPYLHLEPYTDEVLILDDDFDQETEHYCSDGLNKKVISEKLKLLNYREDGEEDELCVICQAEFESNERLGVLECNHRFHSTCIEEWLMRQNVCPLCKCQGLRV